MTTSARILSTDGVAPATSAALRAAMRRLFEGKPQRTDGRLTKENLWREAQVSRATMNRAKPILTEWEAHIAKHGAATPGEARRDDEITKLRDQLAVKTRECTQLRNQLKAAASAIGALHHDNTLLREELAVSGGRVTPLHGHRKPSSGSGARMNHE